MSDSDHTSCSFLVEGRSEDESARTVPFRESNAGEVVYVARETDSGRPRDRRQFAIENVPEGLFVLDRSGRIEFVNEAAAAIFDREPSDLEDTYVRALVSAGELDEEVVDWYSDRVPELLVSETDGETIRYETEVRPGSDDPRFVEISLSLRPSNEEFRGTVGTVRDVTERMERETQLRRERDRLDEFVRVASHDLRNPLNVAKGRLELARQERNSENLEATARALDRMEELVEDLLRLTREGEPATDVTTVPLAETARRCWRTVETPGATVKIEAGCCLTADPGRLRQLLENLFRNSVEHGGEELTVTVGDLDSGFFVEDDGPGIPVDERTRVFESGHSEQADGTGLGLSIVEAITISHGWDVHLTDGREGGARFEFTGVELVEETRPTGSPSD